MTLIIIIIEWAVAAVLSIALILAANALNTLNYTIKCEIKITLK